MVSNTLHSSCHPSYVGRSALHHSGDVFTEGRSHRAAATGCGEDRRAINHLLPHHVLGQLLDGQTTRSGLCTIGHALLHRCREQLRAGDYRSSGRFRPELWRGVCWCRWPLDRGSSPYRPGQCRVLDEAAVFQPGVCGSCRPPGRKCALDAAGPERSRRDFILA
jgi:hypothetical protein